MKRQYSIVGAVVAGLCVACAANASSIAIDTLGGSMMLQAGEFSSLFDGVDPHKFTGADMQTVHNGLHADGVSTNGFVTFLLADTSEGLSFLTLIDDNTVAGFSGSESFLGMSTTGPSSADYFVNDIATENINVSSPFGTSTTVYGEFAWDNDAGDGFAWTGMNHGDGFTFNFTEMAGDALSAVNAFQFVTWNGEAWEVAASANFTADGQFAFSFTVVPLPAPVLMGLAGLAGVMIYRRRRLG